MKIFFSTLVLLFFAKNLLAETIDYAVQVSQSYDTYSDLTIKISKPYEIFHDEVWKVIGSCNNSPNLWIKIAKTYNIYIDLTVKIAKPYEVFSDRKICITNANSLDRKTLTALNLIR